MLEPDWITVGDHPKYDLRHPALGKFSIDPIAAMTNESFELSGGRCWRNVSPNELRFVADLNAESKLVVQGIGQAEGIPFVGFHHRFGPLLHMHHIDGDIQLLQVLDQGFMILSCFLQKREAVLERSQSADAFRKGMKPVARVLKSQSRTCFKALVTLQQGQGDKASNVPHLPNIDADVQ